MSLVPVPRWPVLLAVTWWGCASREGPEPAEPSAVKVTITRDAGAPEPRGAELDAGPAVDPRMKLEREADAVLRSYCIGCHAWTTSFAVHSAAACGGRGSRLVVPGDLKRSRLYGKITGDNVCGGPMPPNAVLPPAAVASIRAWILEGAPIDGRVCVSCLSPKSEVELEVSDLNRDD